jgi:hypothetical protein
MRSFVRVCLVLLALAAAGTRLGAAPIGHPEPGDTVPGAPDVTYADLLRQVLPDLRFDNGHPSATELIDIRHLGGEDWAAEVPKRFEGFTMSAIAVQAGGKLRRLLLVDLGSTSGSAEGLAVLAMFDETAKPRLLDATAVGFDRITYFFEQGTERISPGDDVVLTISMHFNSSQSYVTNAMIMIRDDRLELVDTVSTFAQQLCSHEFHQILSFRIHAAEGRRFSDISVRVDESVRQLPVTCEGETPPAEHGRSIRVTYRWDEAAGRYAPDSDALLELAKENEQRF